MTLRSRLAVAAAAIAIFVSGLDGSMIVSAMPAIGRGLGMPAADSVWLLLAATVPMIGLMLPLGAWADAAGSRSVFIAAGVGYALAALAAGLASGFGGVLAARMAQGVCSSMLAVLVMAVPSQAVGPRSRAMAI